MEEWNLLKIGFDTALSSDGNTNTMILAVAGLDARTSEPAQPIINVTFPLVYASQIEKAEIGQVEIGAKIGTQVEFKAIVTQGRLKRDLSTIAGTASETETDSIVLGVSSKSKAHNCD